MLAIAIFCVKRTNCGSNTEILMTIPSTGVDQVRVRILPDGWVDRKNAAKALSRTPKTLAEWKRLGIGPRAHNRGGRVFYKWEDVQATMSGEAG